MLFPLPIIFIIFPFFHIFYISCLLSTLLWNLPEPSVLSHALLVFRGFISQLSSLCYNYGCLFPQEIRPYVLSISEPRISTALLTQHRFINIFFNNSLDLKITSCIFLRIIILKNETCLSQNEPQNENRDILSSW